MSTARFTAHVRTGLAAGAASGRSEVDLTVDAEGSEVVATATLDLAGPGNVVGLQPRVVARREPAHGSVDARPGGLAFVELTLPGLPWSLAPGTPGGPGLVPWLALLVLPDEHVRLQSAARPLPRLVASGIEGHLPDPADLWAWAHVEGDPDDAHARARLLSPLRLRPDTTYLAAVVPVFEAGRLAGLGEPGDRRDGFAWRPDDDRIETAVYDWWRFTTGRGRGIADLLMALRARRLVGPSPSLPYAPDGVELLRRPSAPTEIQPLPERGSTRPLLRAAPAGDDRLAADIAALSSAQLLEHTQRLGLSARGGEAALRRRMRWHLVDRGVDAAITRLADLDLPALARDPDVVEAFAAAAADGDAHGERRLGLPAYGRLHVRGDDPDPDPDTAAEPSWYPALNGDPGLRLAAGLGAQLVRRRQEELARFAWDAAGQVDDANALLARARAGEVVARELHTRLAALDPIIRLALTAPAHHRIRGGDGTGGSLADDLAGTRTAALGAATVRRALAGGGPLARVAGPDGPALHDAARRAAGTAALPPTPPGTPVLGDDVFDAWTAPGTLSAGSFAQPARLDVTLQAMLAGNAPEGTLDEDDRGRGEAQQSTVGIVHQDGFRPIGPRVEFENVAAWGQELLDAMTPGAAIGDRVHARLPGLAERQGADRLRPVRVAPLWPEPLVDMLATFAPDRVAPGIADLPADSVALLELDVEALEAATVGANHELAGELVWRGFPGDLRASVIRRLFGGVVDPTEPPATDEQGLDAPELRRWGASIGENLGTGDARLPALWLVVRSEVFRRAPGLLVYLASAELTPAGDRRLRDNGARRFPLAMGELGPDITYLGYDLPSAADARGSDDSPGWFVVFEQQPGERSFGLAEPKDHTPRTRAELVQLDSWNRLAWNDVVGEAGAAPQLLTPGGPLDAVEVAVDDGPVWGASAADMAAIFVERPVVVAIHASDLLDARDGASGGTS